MLPTFVIGLREGLEAALIVGIIAAFLRKQGRRDLLRWVFVGVASAITLCVAAGIALNVISKDLPQAKQEGLETIIGALAVGMVTYMVVWMKRHSRELKGQLEGLAADALGGTSGAARAMVAMAFLAVLREGIETVIFLLAAFNQASSGSSAAIGAALGLVVAVGLGYGIYRGGVRINLSRFFRATGLVLVLVAAGLVVNALRTAHEAGWLNAGQGSTINLSWLVSPGSVQASLLTGMLGLQTYPVVIEVVGYLVYLVPVGLYVAWPPGRSLRRRTTSRLLLGTGAVLGVTAVALAFLAPGAPAQRPTTRSGATSVALVSTSATGAVLRTTLPGTDAARDVAMRRVGVQTHDGVVADVYAADGAGTAASTLARTATYERIAQLNGGRLPIGLVQSGRTAQLSYTDRRTERAWVEPRTGRVIDLRVVERVTATASSGGGSAFALSRPVSQTDSGLSSAAARSAAAAARAAVAGLDRATLLRGLAWTFGVLALLTLLAGATLAIPARRREEPVLAEPVDTLVRS